MGELPMTSTDVNEQVRRREFIRDTKAASAQGQELEEYRAKRGTAAPQSRVMNSRRFIWAVIR
jgi:hypothetical protein